LQNNIISRVRNLFRPSNAILDTSVLEAGWHTVNSTIEHYANDKYENGYSSIRAIANRYMTLRPFAIDANGKPLEVPPNVISCLARPNEDMSGVDFRDALAVMTLVHDNVYILVHERYGRGTRPAREGVRENQIAGFTFLENVLEVSVDGKIQYEVYTSGSKSVYYPYQVMHLHDVNPVDLSKGYSATRAARRWTRIDDYIADYQSGFFENGAVPAGQFIITAPTANEYKDIVRNLKKKHKGANKNNKVTYTYAPIDPTTGKPGQAAITWVPFNTTNKDLALKDIFEQSNKKIDSVYGVSAFIRAIDEAPNFATAQVIERNFIENTIRPFALKKWGRIQHELNRITGDNLGYGISFRLDTPHIAEEDQAHAETNMIIWKTIKDMIASGFTYDSAVKTLKLDPNWALLEVGETKGTTIINPKPEVDTEGAGIPDAPTNVKMMTTEDLPGFEMRLEQPARDLMQRQVNHAKDSLDPTNKTGNPTAEDLKKFEDEMMEIVKAILLYGGIQQWEDGKALLLAAGIAQADIPSTAYELSDDAIERYRKYLKNVGDSYSSDNQKAIQAILDRANLDGLTRVETENALQEVLNTDEYRIKRLARSEVNRSSQVGNLEAMEKIADDAEVTIKKVWNTARANPCEYCQALDGKTIGLQETFVPVGGVVEGVDGGKLVNDFVSMDVSSAHPNCGCVMTYVVEGK